MKRILVPTDFSSCARSATNAALSLALKSDSEIHFLHITNVPVDWSGMEQSEKMYPEVTRHIKQTQLDMDKLVHEAEGQGLVARKYLVYNQNYRAILDHINSHEIDMVVMGSTGATGLKEILIGSNTQRIVRLSPVPVFVIKDDSDHLKLEHLVFVSDFNEEIMEQFKSYVHFVQQFNAKLSLLFINTPENFTDTITTKIKMGNYAMHAPGTIENTYIFNSYRFLDGLQTFCQENHADAIGMITHGGFSGLHLFNSSLTEKVVNHSEIPMLTMHFGRD